MHSTSSTSVDELASQNIDWYAAACIYTDETTVLPLQEEQKRGFRGIVRLTIDMTNIAFCRKTSQDGHYRYFTMDKLLILTVALDYVYNDLELAYEAEDEEEEEVPPTNVSIQFEEYPKVWPSAQQSSHISWLTQKCQQAMTNSLGYGSFTYEMIQLCEHELLNFWEVLHQTDDYRLILLPPKMDNLYHSNVGMKIHPRNEAIQLQQKHKKKQQTHPSNTCFKAATSAREYARHALLQCWPKMYFSQCPICFDDTRCDQGTTLPCGDFFCNDCFPQYLHVKVTELAEHRQNPFLCPIQGCRKEMCIETVVKQHTTKENVHLIERWQRDLEFPPCFLLDRCPSKSCSTNTTTCDKSKDDSYMMRRTNNDIKNKFIFCQVCKKQWCELCMHRIHKGVSPTEHREVCEVQMMLKFCRRYLRASDEMKQKCEGMYPWICNYSRGVQEDVGVLSWLMENGQNCPNCGVGVERVSGCFHMTCPTCATHFCYECGQEIFYPFYGTHHCWEEQEMFEQFQ